MSNAPQYTPTANFTQDESVNASGRSTVNTTKLDAELANIATSLNGVNTNLQKLQRDDGKLTDYIVEPYNLADRTRTLIAGGWNPRGNFTPGVVYAVRDFVIANGLQYVCLVAHTSGASFASEAALWMAASSAIDASTAAAAASASAAAAAASEANAATSASTASVAAGSATSSAGVASNAATTASNAAASASSSATSAAQSATTAAAEAATAVSSARKGPIGMPFFWDGFAPPTGALILDSSAIPRATYPELLAVYSNPTACTYTAGSNQVTGVPAMTVALLGGNGAKSPQIPVEGVGIPAGCKVASISGTTITLTANATANGSLLNIFIHGNGNGTTTFNLANGADFWRGKDPSNIKDAGRVLGSSQLSTRLGANPSQNGASLPSSNWVTNGEDTQSLGTLNIVGSDVGTSPISSHAVRPANSSKLPCVWAF